MTVCKFRVKYVINQGISSSCHIVSERAWLHRAEALGEEAGADACWPWLLLHLGHRTETTSYAGRCWHLTLHSSKASGMPRRRWMNPWGLITLGVREGGSGHFSSRTRTMEKTSA